jgi:glycosyltransferase involved in cell wall biosynthesis
VGLPLWFLKHSEGQVQNHQEAISARPGRVLMLVENSTYPSDVRVRREAQSLVGAGYRVTVISPAGSGQPAYEWLDGVYVYRFPPPPEANSVLGYLWEYGYAMVMMFWLSLRVLAREGFDVIHVANPPDTLVLIAAVYKLLGKRFIFDHHDLAPEMYVARFGGRGNPLLTRALLWLERLSCQLADCVIVTNESYRQIDARRNKVPSHKIAVVRNGPDQKQLQPLPPDQELRGLNRTVIGYVGVTGFQDGVDCLLRALGHLVYDVGRTDFVCVIVGKGDALEMLKKLAAELAIEPYVQFRGWVSDPQQVTRYLCSVDICVAPEPSNPYNDHSTVVKMGEYMAAGRPIVAFDLPEHRYTAQDAALYVQPNDELAFARALAELMDDQERRIVMGATGRRRVETDLLWQHSVPRLLQLYQALFAKR